MGMGIVTESDFNKEIDNSCVDKNVPRGAYIPGKGIQIIPQKNPVGRGIGNIAVPEALRKLIGSTSAISGRQEALDLANDFDISPSSVSAYANGAHSTSTYDKKTEVANVITEAKARVSKKARAKLMMALHEITPEKLKDAKLKDVSSVARDMSAIIKNMEPPVTDSNEKPVGGPTFVFYAPQLLPQETFDVIKINEV